MGHNAHESNHLPNSTKNDEHPLLCAAGPAYYRTSRTMRKFADKQRSIQTPKIQKAENSKILNQSMIIKASL